MKFEEFRERCLLCRGLAKKEATSKGAGKRKEREWPRAKMAPQSFIDWEIFAASAGVAHTARKRKKDINLSRNYK